MINIKKLIKTTGQLNSDTVEAAFKLLSIDIADARDIKLTCYGTNWWGFEMTEETKVSEDFSLPSDKS